MENTMQTKEEWKAAQAERKVELKKLRLEAKYYKNELVKCQQELATVMTRYNIQNYNRTNYIRYDNTLLRQVRQSLISAQQLVSMVQEKNDNIRKEIRFKHMIYCLYNGTPLHKIEKPVMTELELSSLWSEVQRKVEPAYSAYGKKYQKEYQRRYDFNLGYDQYKLGIQKALTAQEEYTRMKDTRLMYDRMDLQAMV